MMTANDMARLEKSSGEEFDTAFVTMMIEHHKGGRRDGRHRAGGRLLSAATEMAADIVTSQSAEIARTNS